MVKCKTCGQINSDFTVLCNGCGAGISSTIKIFELECDCSLTTRSLGGGCKLCNTSLYIDMLPNPNELALELQEMSFSHDQACDIAQNVYQPLLSLITTLNNKIDQLAKDKKGA